MVGEEYIEEEYIDEIDKDIIEESALEDSTEKQAEAQAEVYEDAPSYKEKDDLYSLFWKVVKTDESSKVGNLSKQELGMLDISVRDCQKIARLATILGHPGFAAFFTYQAEITLATSASKEGWLPELFVSQKKFSTKKKDMSQNLPQFQPKKKKFSLFGKKNE